MSVQCESNICLFIFCKFKNLEHQDTILLINEFVHDLPYKCFKKKTLEQQMFNLENT